ncbi:MAG: hypothetical protein ACM3X0_01660 [Bacteroidota bacterium]
MNKRNIRDCLERVAVVSRGWADDPELSASLRHMSLHVHQLASEVGRRKEICSTSIRNVQARFCLMCRRLKAGSGECRGAMEHCHVLQGANAAVRCARVINLGLLETAPKTVPELAEASLP